MTATSTTATVRPMQTSTAAPARHLNLPVGAAGILPVIWSTFIVTVVLALIFSFGNVWDLGRTLHVERHVAPLIGPAVDFTAIGLLIVVPWLVLAGVSAAELKSAMRLMRLAGALTLALNSAPSAIKGWIHRDPTAWGRALVEAIVPLLLIAWSHVGPTLIALFVGLRDRHAERVAEMGRRTAEDSAEAAARRAEEIRSAVDEAVRGALSAVAAEHSEALAALRAETEEMVAELQVSEGRYRSELETAVESERRLVAELDAAREALSTVQAELREARKDARRKTVSGGSRKPVERAPRRSEDEWVDLAKERLPEWQIETPTGSVIGSALDLSSAGTISKIRQRLEADRLAVGGTT